MGLRFTIPSMSPMTRRSLANSKISLSMRKCTISTLLATRIKPNRGNNNPPLECNTSRAVPPPRGNERDQAATTLSKEIAIPSSRWEARFTSRRTRSTRGARPLRLSLKSHRGRPKSNRCSTWTTSMSTRPTTKGTMSSCGLSPRSSRMPRDLNYSF